MLVLTFTCVRFVPTRIFPHQSQYHRAQQTVLHSARRQIRFGFVEYRFHHVRSQTTKFVLVQLIRYLERIGIDELKIKFGERSVFVCHSNQSPLGGPKDVVLRLLDQDEQPFAEICRYHVHQTEPCYHFASLYVNELRKNTD